MYGRLVEVEGVDASKRDEVVEMIRERIIPGLKEIEGFAGFISLTDPENSRARSVVLWETKEGAEEAERRFKARREEMVSRRRRHRSVGRPVRSVDRRGTRRSARLRANDVGPAAGPTSTLSVCA